jgi:Ca-activated chloride channel family protein
VGLGLSLAVPRLADTHVETETAGLDFMLALDLSWSMMALDMGRAGECVTRFGIARDVLKDFIHKRTSDRIGLVVFSAVPYLASPLTLNHDWLIEHLQRLHVGRLQELGTAIGDAIAMSAKRLKDLPESKSRIIILLTDGETTKAIDPLPAAQLAAALGAKIYTIGIGIEQAVPTAHVRPGHRSVVARSGRKCDPHPDAATGQLHRAWKDVAAFARQFLPGHEPPRTAGDLQPH